METKPEATKFTCTESWCTWIMESMKQFREAESPSPFAIAAASHSAGT